MGSKDGKLAILMGFLPSNSDASVQLKKIELEYARLEALQLYFM
jgi:hypothetical protein